MLLSGGTLISASMAAARRDLKMCCSLVPIYSVDGFCERSRRAS
jgi:hypothetical protein